MKFVAYIFVLLLFGCDQQHLTASATPATNNSSAARYQIVANSEGGVWQLDAQTGDMKWCASFASVAMGPVCYKAIDK